MEVNIITVIGFIGSGNIGQVLARQVIAAGYDVVMSNSRRAETLAPLVAALGPKAQAATSDQAAAAGDLVVVAIPFRNVAQVPVQPLAGKVVIDPSNYYPPRDGHIATIDNGEKASSEVLAAHLPTSKVVKAFNAIMAAQIVEHATPPGTPHRRAIPIAGDDEQAKGIVAALIDQIGFDTVDVGRLVDGRRIESTDAWGPVLDAGALRTLMDTRTRR
jgi:8-hydroxy-5-deazaflavin:NADPH oxidoreductase